MSEKEKNYRKVLKMEFRRQLKQVLINYPLVGAEVLRKSDLDKNKAEKIETVNISGIVMDPEAIFAGSYVLDIDPIIRAVVCADMAKRSLGGPTAKDKADALEVYNKCMKEKIK